MFCCVFITKHKYIRNALIIILISLFMVVSNLKLQCSWPIEALKLIPFHC